MPTELDEMHRASLRTSSTVAIDHIEDLLEPNSLGSGFLARIMTQRGYPLTATSIAVALQTGATAYTTRTGDCALVVPYFVAQTALRVEMASHAKSGLLVLIGVGNPTVRAGAAAGELFTFRVRDEFYEDPQHTSDADLLFYVTAFLEEQNLHQHLVAWNNTDPSGYIRGRNAFERLGEFLDGQVQRYFGIVNAISRKHGGEGLSYLIPQIRLGWRASRSVNLAAQRLWEGRLTHEFLVRRMSVSCHANLHDTNNTVTARYPLFRKTPVSQPSDETPSLWNESGITILPFSVEGAVQDYISLPPFTQTALPPPREPGFATNLPPELTVPAFVPSPASNTSVSLNDATTMLRDPPTFIRPPQRQPVNPRNVRSAPIQNMVRPAEHSYRQRRGGAHRVPSAIGQMHIGDRPDSPSMVGRLVHVVSDFLKKE